MPKGVFPSFMGKIHLVFTSIKKQLLAILISHFAMSGSESKKR
jgi:hypothetical protein